jgi:hypothetical protein
MHTRQQGAVLFSGILIMLGMLVVIQLWLLTAGLEALLAHDTIVLVPAAVASFVLLAVNALLLRYVISFDASVRREDSSANQRC